MIVNTAYNNLEDKKYHNLSRMASKMKPYLFLYFFILISVYCRGQNEVILPENTLSTDSVLTLPTDTISILPTDTIPVLSTDTISALLTDTISPSPTDTSLVKEKKHSPKLAGLLSAAVPGLGQAYNKKYWKIPIDYAGFAATGFCVYHFHKLYASYRDEYRNRLNENYELLNPDWQHLNTENINTWKQYHQRNMQLSIIVLSIWYFVNILDAVVDAHLMTYDISDNLSMRILPDIHSGNFARGNSNKKQTIGLSFTLNLKL